MTQHFQHDILTQVLSRLTRTEQLQVMMTHPFFTGQCPQCQQEFEQVQSDPGRWHCVRCGWVDASGDSLEKLTPQNNSAAINPVQVKRLES